MPIKSLNDLLSLDKGKLKAVVTTIVKKNYMDKRAKSSFTEDNVSPKDDLILNLMEYLIDNGETEEYFINIADMFDGDYTQKSRYRQMVKKFLSNIQFKERLQQNMADAKDGDLLGFQFGLWDLKPNT
jgi:tryptophanyl-tRNA synthetase